MNFNILEGCYADLESIHDDFCNDYLWSNELSNYEIRKKYNLTASEFREFSMFVKKEYGFNRRPKRGNYYYPTPHGFFIQRTINCAVVYFGFVPRESVAKKMVELCEKHRWNVDVCRDIVKNWKDYIV